MPEPQAPKQDPPPPKRETPPPLSPLSLREARAPEISRHPWWQKLKRR
jgi:hypothetical protein